MVLIFMYFKMFFSNKKSYTNSKQLEKKKTTSSATKDNKIL